MKDRLRHVLSDVLNWLNGIGSVLLAYALMNPTAASDLVNILPANLRTPAALAAPAAWFVFVQYAKARSLKKVVATPPAA